MKTKLWIPALLAAATLSTSAFAQSSDRHDGRNDGHNNGRNQHATQQQHRHVQPPPPPQARWQHQAPSRYTHRDARNYRYQPTRHDQPTAKIYLPLPSPLAVHHAIVDALFNR